MGRFRSLIAGGSPRPARLYSPHGHEVLTAAAKAIEPSGSGAPVKTVQEWQRRALAYYDTAGEAHFSADFYGKALAEARIFPATRGDSGELEESDDERAIEVLDRIQDPGGGREQMQASYGRLKFLVGEGFLLGYGSDDGERWEFLSGNELRFVEGADRTIKIERFADGGTRPSAEYTQVSDTLDGELAEGQAIAYRMWTRHPAVSGRADSPMRAVLDLFEELKLLEQAVRARVKSRLAAAGMLVIDDSIMLPKYDVEEDDSDPLNDPFLRSLINHMTEPISNDGSASAVVPHVLRVQGNAGEQSLKDLFLHLKFHDPNETYRETGLREECINRIAIGLDLPPEVLKGMAEANHWTAWQIDDQVARAHVFPMVRAWCDDLTSAYFRPALQAAGVDNADEFLIGFDEADLVVNPDTSDDARELFDRQAIGHSALRKRHGVEDDEKPTAEELALMREFEKVGAAPESPVDGEPPDEPEQPPAEDDETMPPVAVAASVNGNRAYVRGAAEAYLDRCRDLAGSKLRSTVQRSKLCPDCAEQISHVANVRVAAQLGERQVNDLDLNSLDLVRGGAPHFVATLGRWGLGDNEASYLAEQIEMHAARTLYETAAPELPPGFDSAVGRMLNAAGTA